MDLLHNTVQRYAWGSHYHLARLQNRKTPSIEPEAEMWMGAHPSAPSLLRRNGTMAPLTEVLAADPATELGPASAEFGGRLPYLLKYLAAAVPLSIQVHPNASQAADGFAAEELAGLASNDPKRNYRDASHKPELLCALTEFEGLCGFRPLDEAVEVFSGIDALAEYAHLLARPGGLRNTVTALLHVSDARQLVEATLRECQAAVAAGIDPLGTYALATRIATHFPADIGVIVAMLLNHLKIQPGQAIYIPAGVMHAYLSGAGVEVMASSDNVLRGGLTPKHIDVVELLRITQWSTQAIPVLSPTVISAGITRFETPAREFALWRVSLDGGSVTVPAAGPAIVFCTEGSMIASDSASTVDLSPGMSAFSPAQVGPPMLTGTGTVFIAAPN